jgi:hypothetical protein
MAMGKARILAGGFQSEPLERAKFNKLKFKNFKNKKSVAPT